MYLLYLNLVDEEVVCDYILFERFDVMVVVVDVMVME